MSSCLVPMKRKLSSATRSVSPPSLRRRLSPSKSSSTPNAGSDKNELTFYSWNVNGIGALLQKQIKFSSKSIYPLRTFLKDHNWPYLLCLQEVKINRNDETTQRRVELAANAGGLPHEPTYTTHFSMPKDKYNATGFGGKVHGVASLVRDDGPPSSVRRPDWDLEGRVLIHDFPSLQLTVVNGYWVNGTSNPYRNPNTGDVDGTRHDHKLRFHAHMLNLCKSIEKRNWNVLLLGDMNIAPKRIDGHPNLRTSPDQHVKNRADFNDKFFNQDNEDGLGGVDVFRHLHGEKRKYTYHGRGRPWGESCDRVDLIIASRKLVEAGAVSGTDICDTPKERGHSDHVPLCVSINVGKIVAEIDGYSNG